MSISELAPFVRVYLTVLTFIFALIMGSALNCLAYRMAKGVKWSKGRSVCAKCGHELSWRDLFPLFSWLFLKGRCRYCGERISIRYPLSELVLAAAYVAVLFRVGLTIELPVYLVLVSCLFCLSLIDIDTLTIPNRFIIIPAVCRLIQLFVSGGFSGLWYGVYHALILGGGIFLLSLLMDKVLKKESMGGGDIKLLFMLGLFFDVPCSLLLIVLACIVGIIASLLMRVKSGTPFPFGPSISIAAFLTMLFGYELTGWYISLF